MKSKSHYPQNLKGAKGTSHNQGAPARHAPGGKGGSSFRVAKNYVCLGSGYGK